MAWSKELTVRWPVQHASNPEDNRNDILDAVAFMRGNQIGASASFDNIVLPDGRGSARRTQVPV